MIRSPASQKQVDAAHPRRSTWVSANAGSGKTRVLTDRVARLLLDDVPPDHILCLTYTKAAATEMQNRLFQRLGAWAMKPDAALRADLEELGVEGGLGPDRLRAARTLFARAIETPGGLRIQTIHSFCAALLRRFPLEAGVSPQFLEIEDRAADLLRDELLDTMAEGPGAVLLEDVAAHITDDGLPALAAAVCKARDSFAAPLDEAALRRAYGLPPGLDRESLLAEVFWGDTLAFVAEVAGIMLGLAGEDLKMGHRLKAVQTVDATGQEALEAAFLTARGEPRKKLANNPTRDGVLAPYWDRFETLAAVVHDAREKRLSLAAAERDIALHRFARAFVPRYEAAKAARGWLDFDDLIDRARGLLTDDRVAQWVLYRLDGGIDHILVDEAQDTSPAQWKVIEQLAREFTSGEGARAGVLRTIFVVGDKKQSIYSFQGADAQEFDRMRAEFEARLETTPTPLQSLTLAYSFRSAAPVLRAVDAAFDGREASGFPAGEKHIAFHDALPGRVDLWPPVPKAQAEADETEWYRPVDHVSPVHHTVVLARRIARTVRGWIDSAHPLPVRAPDGTIHARPVQAGDVLILVRGRQRLFQEIIRACKQEGLPIAGADRLRVMQELAVRDIAALLSFLDTQEDELSLACALRSPLFGLSEQDLFGLAYGRGKEYLWAALQARAADYPEVLATLHDLRDHTDFLRPYDLIERILTRHDGRRRLLGRLGQEAEDGLNALLAQALAYERTEVPSLTGFLHWMQTDELEIKRQADSAGGRLRVMTVHGAKGLEAPIVILPDCKQKSPDHKGLLLSDDAGIQWKTRSEAMPQRQSDALARFKAAQQREADRLLYVAMTRAEKWLVVASVDDFGKDGGSWYETVKRGIEACAGHAVVPYDFGEGPQQGLRLGGEGWDDLPLRVTRPEDGPAAPAPVPDWMTRPAPEPERPPAPRSASDLGGAKALPGEGEDNETARARGTAVHLLLEHLPRVAAQDRSAAARRLLDRCCPDIPAPDRPALADEALAVLEQADLSWVFAPDALTEVTLAGHIDGLGPVTGIVDRLLIRPDRVVLIDYKTNRQLPARPEDAPEGLLRQMGAYAALLRQIYPDREVETVLLWTLAARAMTVPHDLVSAALHRAHLDLGGTAP